jgi:hypothetical protein
MSGARFSHLCQYITRRNISVAMGRGVHVCNRAADAFGEDYYPEGATQPMFVTMCTKHAEVWAKKAARIKRARMVGGAR